MYVQGPSNPVEPVARALLLFSRGRRRDRNPPADISGLALSNLIRTQFGPELGIVVMSGQTIDGLQDRLLDAGADDFMRRPFAPQTLVDRLSQLIDGH